MQKVYSTVCWVSTLVARFSLSPSFYSGNVSHGLLLLRPDSDPASGTADRRKKNILLQILLKSQSSLSLARIYLGLKET